MKKVLSLVLALTMLLSLVACGDGGGASSGTSSQGGQESQSSTTSQTSGTESAETSEAGQLDISEPVELVVYFPYDAPQDLDQVTAAINEITQEKLNCTVKFNAIGTADQETKYNLLLSTGEDCDLVFEATWFSYADKANNNAFIPIEDMVDTYVPELREIISQEVWDECKINGHDYAIPGVRQNCTSAGFLYREDLRQKYGVPEITDMDTIAQYCDAIIANEPNMLPMYSHANDMFTIYNSMYHEHTGIGHPYFHYFVCSLDEPRDLHVSVDTENFKDYCTWAREWVEKGYVQSDAVSNTEDHASVMLAGKYASSIFNTAYETLLTTVILPAETSNPDWEFGYISWAEMFKISMPNVPFQGSFAIPYSSQNPERALLFVKELLTNEELSRLVDCGIEGTHYEVDDEGNYVSLNDAENPGYLQNAMGFSNLINPEFQLRPSYYSKVEEQYDRIVDYAVYNYKEAFPVNIEPVRDYVNALSLTYQQYGYPLVHGQIADVESGIATFKEKMVEAGADIVFEEYNRQWQEYLDYMGVPAAE